MEINTLEIRKNLQKGMILDKALGQAIDYYLEHGILVDILRRSQAEVRSMLLEEYDEKAEREYLRKEAIEEGWKEGLEKGIEQGIEEGIKQGIEQGMVLGSFETLAALMDKKLLSMEQVEKQLGDRKEEFTCWYQKRRKEKNASA